MKITHSPTKRATEVVILFVDMREGEVGQVHYWHGRNNLVGMVARVVNGRYIVEGLGDWHYKHISGEVKDQLKIKVLRNR